MTRESTSSFAFSLGASALSAAALVLAFPDFDVEWLAWFGLAPFFVALCGRRVIPAVVASYLFGAVFVTGVCRWIFEVEGFSALHYLLVVAYLGAYYAVFGGLFACIQRQRGAATALVAAPFLWVSLEYARSNASFLSLPWGLMAHTQHLNYPIIQVSSITGAYGVSFLVVAVNAALALGILSLGPFRSLAPAPVSKRTLLFSVCGVTALLTLALAYGRHALEQPVAGRKIKIAVLQGNIAQERKWDRDFASFIRERYSGLTKEAALGKPDLIIWPEAATPGYVLQSSSLLPWLRDLVREANAFFIVGSAEPPKFMGAAYPKDKQGNSALYYGADGQIRGQYLKMHLVPFTEYLPFEGRFPWPDWIAKKGQQWDLPGKDAVLFQYRNSLIGVVICWESIFPELFRGFVRDGANLMVNITNEGWFRDLIQYQYLAMNVFRAVENRVCLVRAANVGVSCVIDPHGRVIGRVRKNDSDLNVEGYLIDDVLLLEERTFYTRNGDVFVYSCIAVTALVLILAFRVRGFSGGAARRRRRPPG